MLWESTVEKVIVESIQAARRAVLRDQNIAFGKLLDFYDGQHGEHTQAMLKRHCADDSYLANDTTMHRHVPFVTSYVRSVCVSLVKPPSLVLVDQDGNDVPLRAIVEGQDPGPRNEGVAAWDDICKRTNLFGALARLDELVVLGRCAFLYLRPKGDLLHFDVLDRRQILVAEHDEFPGDLMLAKAIVVGDRQSTEPTARALPLTSTVWTRTEDEDGKPAWGCYRVNRQNQEVSEPVFSAEADPTVNPWGVHPVVEFCEWEPTAGVFLPVDYSLLQTQLVTNKNWTVLDEAAEFASLGQKTLKGMNVGASDLTLGPRKVLELQEGENYDVVKSDANLAGMTQVLDRSQTTEVALRGLPAGTLSSTEPANNTGAAQSARRAGLRDERRRRESQVVRCIDRLFAVARVVWNHLHPDREIDPTWRLRVALAYDQDLDPPSRQSDAQARRLDYESGVLGEWETWLERHGIDPRSATEAQRKMAMREVARNAGLHRALINGPDKPAGVQA